MTYVRMTNSVLVFGMGNPGLGLYSAMNLFTVNNKVISLS